MAIANLILLVFVSSASSRIYLYTLNYVPNDESVDNARTTPLPDILAELESIRLIERIKNMGTKEHTCQKTFGSIYGTKRQKLNCLNHWKSKRSNISKQRTRSNGLKRFWSDYVDVDGLSRYANDNTEWVGKDSIETLIVNSNESPDEGQQLTRKNDHKDMRKFLKKTLKNKNIVDSSEEYGNLIIEKNKNDQYESSQESGDGNKGRHERKKEKELKKSKSKKKKFNADVSNENERYESSSQECFERFKNGERLKRYKVINNCIPKGSFKPGRNKLNKLPDNPEHDSIAIDSFESGTMENFDSGFEKKKENHKKKENEMYIQGGTKYINIVEDNRRRLDDGGRRLDHFLPKRHFWGSHEIQNLGYYWFNGPQGRTLEK